MNAEPKPYLLPKLSDIWRGVNQGAVAGTQIGWWSVPATMATAAAWFWFSVPSPIPVVESVTSLAYLVISCAPGAIFGWFAARFLGGIAGGSIYAVLFPFLPSECWPEMNDALSAGLKRGATIGQIISAVLPILIVGPWSKSVLGWIALSDWGFLTPLLWCLSVPCAATLGGFIYVARLMIREKPEHVESRFE